MREAAVNGHEGSRTKLLDLVLLTAMILPAGVSSSFAIEPALRPTAAAGSNRAPVRAPAGCNRTPSREGRLALLDSLTARLKTDLAKSPGVLKDPATRDLMGTFIAGSLDDDVPFVSLDRWCWADFHEAHRFLVAKDSTAALQSAGAWKICLAATFPQRMELALPYFSCFGS